MIVFEILFSQQACTKGRLLSFLVLMGKIANSQSDCLNQTQKFTCHRLGQNPQGASHCSSVQRFGSPAVQIILIWLTDFGLLKG